MRGQQPETLDGAETAGSEIARLEREVADLRRQVAQLDRMAHEDALVGLPNRRGFMRRLDHLIERVRRYGEAGAMLFIDINGLKTINDSFGHAAGDAALVQVAQRLVQGVRASDSVARIGGDEFAVLLEHADDKSARETAARLVDTVAARDFTHNGDTMPLSVAVGVALIADSDRPEDVISRADAEMYAEKTRG